jgi:hypothetical protein
LSGEQASAIAIALNSVANQAQHDRENEWLRVELARLMAPVDVNQQIMALTCTVIDAIDNSKDGVPQGTRHDLIGEALRPLVTEKARLAREVERLTAEQNEQIATLMAVGPIEPHPDLVAEILAKHAASHPSATWERLRTAISAFVAKSESYRSIPFHEGGREWSEVEAALAACEPTADARGDRAYEDIHAERARQIEKGRTPEKDDERSLRDWFECLSVVRDKHEYDGRTERETWVKVGSVAVAAIESIDRKAANIPDAAGGGE